jgi:hypothetical protein
MDANSRIIKQYRATHPLMHKDTMIAACDGEIVRTFLDNDEDAFESCCIELMRRVLSGSKSFALYEHESPKKTLHIVIDNSSLEPRRWEEGRQKNQTLFFKVQKDYPQLADTEDLVIIANGEFHGFFTNNSLQAAQCIFFNLCKRRTFLSVYKKDNTPSRPPVYSVIVSWHNHTVIPQTNICIHSGHKPLLAFKHERGFIVVILHLAVVLVKGRGVGKGKVKAPSFAIDKALFVLDEEGAIDGQAVVRSCFQQYALLLAVVGRLVLDVMLLAGNSQLIRGFAIQHSFFELLPWTDYVNQWQSRKVRQRSIREKQTL